LWQTEAPIFFQLKFVGQIKKGKRTKSVAFAANESENVLFYFGDFVLKYGWTDNEVNWII
jgi:hypothetical protein